jgi:hypothetical protein
LKWYVERNSVNIWIDLSGIIAPNVSLFEWNVGVYEGHEKSTDNYYRIINPSAENTDKFSSVDELLIDCFNEGIAIIEERIKADSCIFVFTSNGGGSHGGVWSMEDFQRFLFSSDTFNQIPCHSRFTHNYFTPLINPDLNVFSLAVNSDAENNPRTSINT